MNNFKPKKSRVIIGKLRSKSGDIVRKRPYLVPIFGLIIGGAVVWLIVASHGGDELKPSSSHVVFLYDGGKTRTINTNKKTVNELLDKLNLNLQPHDEIEPSRNTDITADNFRINIYRARPIIFVDEDNRIVALSARKSPRTAAQEIGLTLQPEDEVRFQAGDIKQNIIGEQVIIERAIPVSLNLYGQAFSIKTRSKTVGELIEERKIKLAEGDSLQPEAKTPLTANLSVYIIRKGTKIATVEEVVKPPLQEVKDPNLTRGTTAVRQAGKSGKKVVTYQINEQNGREVSRTPLAEVVIINPVPRIVAVGAAAFGGSLQDWLYKLRQCETHGNYQTNTGNGYYGAYQFAAGTWRTLNTGYEYAHLAPPEVQDQAVIRNTLRASGGLASQHPGCYKKLGLSKFPPPN